MPSSLALAREAVVGDPVVGRTNAPEGAGDQHPPGAPRPAAPAGQALRRATPRVDRPPRAGGRLAQLRVDGDLARLPRRSPSCSIARTARHRPAAAPARRAARRSLAQLLRVGERVEVDRSPRAEQPCPPRAAAGSARRGFSPIRLALRRRARRPSASRAASSDAAGVDRGLSASTRSSSAPRAASARIAVAPIAAPSRATEGGDGHRVAERVDEGFRAGGLRLLHLRRVEAAQRAFGRAAAERVGDPRALRRVHARAGQHVAKTGADQALEEGSRRPARPARRRLPRPRPRRRPRAAAGRSPPRPGSARSTTRC